MWDAVDQVLVVRTRHHSGRGLALGLAAATLLHAGAFIAFALAPGGSHPPPLEYVAVKVVPLAALGEPDAPLRPTRRPPEPRPETEPAPPEPEPAAEPKPPADETRPEPTGPVMPVPGAETPTPRAPATPEPGGGPRAGTPEGSPEGSSPFGATRLEGIDPDFTYDYYLDRMLALIHGGWQRPHTEGEVRAVLRFTVRKSGEIADLEMAEESGFSTFDLAALRAVQNASPLPPLPASYRKGELRVTLIVR